MEMITVTEMVEKFPGHTFEVFDDVLWIDNLRASARWITKSELIIMKNVHHEKSIDAIREAFFKKIQFVLDERRLGPEIAARYKK